MKVEGRGVEPGPLCFHSLVVEWNEMIAQETFKTGLLSASCFDKTFKI